MNAGKSTALLQADHNYFERGMNSLLFTARLDYREVVVVISSRIGIKKGALTFEKGDQLFTIIEGEQQRTGLDCVLIDEAKFLTREQVMQLNRVVD